MPIAAAIPKAINDLIEAKGMTMDNFANLKYLQIKRKTLADEGAHIHKAERKLPRLRDIKPEDRTERRKALAAHRYDLHMHRKHIVRPAARAANLAYAFLKGMDYDRVENNTPLWDLPAPNQLVENAHRFGPTGNDKRATYEAVRRWLKAGGERVRERRKAAKAA